MLAPIVSGCEFNPRVGIPSVHIEPRGYDSGERAGLFTFANMIPPPPGTSIGPP